MRAPDFHFLLTRSSLVLLFAALRLTGRQLIIAIVSLKSAERDLLR